MTRNLRNRIYRPRFSFFIPGILWNRNPLTLEHGVPTCISAIVAVDFLVVLVPYLVDEPELQCRDHHGHRRGQRRAVEPHALFEVDHLGRSGVESVERNQKRVDKSRCITSLVGRSRCAALLGPECSFASVRQELHLLASVRSDYRRTTDLGAPLNNCSCKFDFLLSCNERFKFQLLWHCVGLLWSRAAGPQSQ